MAKKDMGFEVVDEHYMYDLFIGDCRRRFMEVAKRHYMTRKNAELVADYLDDILYDNLERIVEGAPFKVSKSQHAELLRKWKKTKRYKQHHKDFTDAWK